MEFLVGVLILVLLVRWAVLSRRLREIEQKVEQEAAQRRASETLVAQVLQRVHALESGLASRVEAMAKRAEHIVAVETAEATVAAEVDLKPAAAAPLFSTPVAPPPIPASRVCQFCGREVESGAAICVCGAVLDYAAASVLGSLTSDTEAAGHPEYRPELAPPPLPEPFSLKPPIEAVPEPAPISAPRESMRDRLRKQVGDEGWEAMVGGSWLNKVGVLVLVIGIALLLGYEFGRVGPAGRVAIGLGVSLILLIGGVVLERRPVYAIFARGLIGGGWAALYFTTYAMHAVEAARVIENAYAATVLLLAVATGMILHSLRYHSQAVSGLAYFAAFATLALGENTPFSVIALIPLAGSLLAIAYRFEWYKMAVFGLFATYATCASRPDTGAPLGTTQALFASYWLLFETFDLMRARKRVSGFRVESLILPLNALGFLTLSIVKWHRVAIGNLWMLLAAGGAAYLVSALLRAAMVPPSSFPETSDTPERVASGGYEGPITLSAALAGASIYLKAPGMWINAGLVIEGEILFLAGLRFGQKYLRQSAGAAFVGSLAKLLFVDIQSPGTIAIAGRQWLRWSPVAIATSGVFYFNRFLREAGGALYSSAAAALIAVVLGYETPHQYLCAAWLGFAAILFELGYRGGKREFLFQSYAIGALGTGAGLALNIALPAPGWRHEWLPMALATTICCYLVARVFRSAPDRIAESEREWLRDLSATAATLFAMSLAWLELPAPTVALAWSVASLILLELGFTFSLPRFRFLGNVVAAVVFGRLFFANFTNLGNTVEISHRLLTVIPIILSQYYVWSRYRDIETTDAERSLARFYLWAPAILGVTLIRFELGRSLAVVGWALFGLALYRTGVASKLTDLRWQSYMIALLAFWRSWNTNFYIPESLAGIRARVLTGAIVIASFYCAQLISPRDSASTDPGGSRLDRHARTFYSLLASALLAVLLFYEVSGGVLTMAWGVEAVAVLGAGFPLRDRVQRLSGLFLFMVCVLKLFLYDLRQLETINRILSFIVLGVILVSVSWIYTRFRDRIQRYL